jgi:aminoglycoside phosphotransferase (APT) family kinase protein
MPRYRARTDGYAPRHEAEAALRGCGAFATSVTVDGQMRRLETGLNHQNYVFYIEGVPEQRGGDLPYVLRKLSRGHAYDSEEEAVDSLKQEAATLRSLGTRELPSSVPRFVCFVGGDEGSPSGFIETGIPGLGLNEMKKFEHRRGFVLESVARVAAVVHQLPVDGFTHLPDDRGNHIYLQAELGRLDADFVGDDPDAATTVAWVREHFPAERPRSVLHGDLLPQNLVWDYDSDRLGVFDWEDAKLGDPAYDLAIVTRGHAKPFGKQAGGLQQFVDAYHQAGGLAVTWTEVVSYELLMVLDWLWGAVKREREDRQEGHPPEFYRNQIRAMLRRAKTQVEG